MRHGFPSYNNNERLGPLKRQIPFSYGAAVNDNIGNILPSFFKLVKIGKSLTATTNHHYPTRSQVWPMWRMFNQYKACFGLLQRQICHWVNQLNVHNMILQILLMCLSNFGGFELESSALIAYKWVKVKAKRSALLWKYFLLC